MQLTTQISRGFQKLAIFRRSRDASSIGRKVRFQCNICGAFCSVPAAELLEMRLFSRNALLREFVDAGFASVRIADESEAAYGIVWPEPWSIPMVAYASLPR